MLAATRTIATARYALAEKFSQVGIDSADVDARLLMAHVLGIDRAELMANGERALNLDEMKAIDALGERRLKREPVARIFGRKEFWNLSLQVSPAVLVPRPETETVIEAALDAVMRDGLQMEKLRILDIGCGAGLLCEPFTRLGAQVIGVDPSATNIAAAKLHADKGHLSIDYRCTTVEQMDVRERFDIVLAMEVVEHVSDIGMFLNRCAAMLKPGGLMLVSTLNRNWKSFALAIVGAEYVLRWLPRGTHQWDKFVTPNELELAFERAGLQVTGERGVIYNPFADRWQLSSDMDVNYMLVAERAKEKSK